MVYGTMGINRILYNDRNELYWNFSTLYIKWIQIPKFPGPISESENYTSVDEIKFSIYKFAF